MHPMMYGHGPGAGFFILFAVHALAALAFAVGALFLLVWSVKHLTERSLWKWGWILVIAGGIICVLTLAASFGMRESGFGFEGKRMIPMMGGDQGWYEGAAQTDGEKKGQDLYARLQSKQTTCADLSEGDFELIGEYAMGQQAGAGHGRVNGMLQMMGADGEKQTRIAIGRNVSGCMAGSAATPASASSAASKATR